MKKLVLFVAMAATVAFTSCSKDDDDADAIVGTWVSESSVSFNGGEEQTETETWKFNSDLTGSYSDSSNGTVEMETDFKWTKTESNYEIDYSNEEVTDETFSIGELLGQQTLDDEEGNPIAIRE